MLKEHQGNRGLFGIRCTQSTPNPVKCSQLKVASRPYSVVFLEGRSKCSFGGSGRSRQIRYADVQAGPRLEQLVGTADDFPSWNLRSSYRVNLARLSLPENFTAELSQLRRRDGRCK